MEPIDLRLKHNDDKVWAGFSSVVPIAWAEAYDRYLGFRGEGKTTDEAMRLAKYGDHFTA